MQDDSTLRIVSLRIVEASGKALRLLPLDKNAIASNRSRLNKDSQKIAYLKLLTFNLADLVGSNRIKTLFDSLLSRPMCNRTNNRYD